MVTAKLVLALCLLCINFMLTLPLLILTLPLLRLNPILVHHHAHYVSEQKSTFLTVILVLGRLLPWGFKGHNKGFFSDPPSLPPWKKRPPTPSFSRPTLP
jgi:hypothetical protein